MFKIIGSHPWQAEIIVLQKQRKPSKMHLCSAVILSHKHILTSASCLTDYPIKKYRVVVAGSDKNSPEQEFMLQSIFTHDGYNEDTAENKVFAGHNFFFPRESEARTWPRHNRKDEYSGNSRNLIGNSRFCASAVFALLGGTLAKYTTVTPLSQVWDWI